MIFSHRNEKKLFKLIKKGETSAVATLLKTAKIDLGYKLEVDNFANITALRYAVRLGRLQIVKLLVDVGADIYEGNLADRYSLLSAAVTHGRKEIVDYLLAQDKDKKHIIHHQALKDLIRWHYDEGARDIMQSLYEKGYTKFVNTQDDDLQTLLHLAVGRDKKAVVTFLLEHGALELKNKVGLTAYDLAGSKDDILALFPQYKKPAPILKENNQTVSTERDVVVFETRLDGERTLCEIFNFKQNERISYLKMGDSLGPMTREHFDAISGGIKSLEDAYEEHIRRGGTSALTIANQPPRDKARFSQALVTRALKAGG
jgi:hypothetical protein